MSFEYLYQEIILDHYRNPCNFGKLDCDTAKEYENPVCGDRLQLIAEVDENDIIHKIKFNGSGCAISMSSASMMTEAVKGKPLKEARKIIEVFVQIMRGEAEPEALEEYGDLVALQGVIKFPVRIKCATLAWHALEDTLEPKKESS